ncbi:hypothetical protein HYX12_02770 [Candidatus Woesearchaeota archaeon]|nr:hypothetical protein [Candidatus Woesearchaeota archaeon]
MLEDIYHAILDKPGVSYIPGDSESLTISGPHERLRLYSEGGKLWLDYHKHGKAPVILTEMKLPIAHQGNLGDRAFRMIREELGRDSTADRVILQLNSEKVGQLTRRLEEFCSFI